MHIIQIVRNYLGFTQTQLAQAAGLSQADICEMETKEPFGRVDKYQRLSDYLGIPIHALVTNDCTMIPLSFFCKHAHAPYSEQAYNGNMRIGRGGEDAVFEMEKQRLNEVNPSLAKLVLPCYKMRVRSGYDLLSFHEDGRPIYIEVKTTTDSKPEFTLTRPEYEKACKAVEDGETYCIFRYTNWGAATQELKVYDFAQFRQNYKIAPSTYLCSMVEKATEVSGITRYREAMGMTMKELADYLGVAVPMLWRYETGEAGCPVQTLRRMSAAMGATIDELLNKYSE